jgi:Na+/phosphate symporter
METIIFTTSIVDYTEDLEEITKHSLKNSEFFEKNKAQFIAEKSKAEKKINNIIKNLSDKYNILVMPCRNENFETYLKLFIDGRTLNFEPFPNKIITYYI